MLRTLLITLSSMMIDEEAWVKYLVEASVQGWL